MGAALTAHVERERAADRHHRTRRCPGGWAPSSTSCWPSLNGNALLERYLSEVIWRCALILAVHGRDHDQRGSVEEHQRLVELMAAGDADGAEALIAQHIAAVEERTLTGVGQAARLDVAAVLSRY